MSAKDNFCILLGDTSEILSEISESEGFKTVLGKDRKDGWGLYKTENGFYWDIDEEVDNLRHQFMICKQNMKIYVFFPFRQKNVVDAIKRWHNIVERDLANYTGKSYIFVGLDFEDHKFQRKIKKELIQWCLELENNEGQGYCSYCDLDDLNIIW